MSFAASPVNPTYTRSVLAGVHSFGVSVRNAFSTTTQKIKDVVALPIGQRVVGFGLGLGVHKIYVPLTEKIIKLFGLSAVPPNPFIGLGLGFQILLTPFVCVIAPIREEEAFRGELQKDLKNNLSHIYKNLGLAESVANTSARVTSVFFTSLIFGLMHFINAVVCWCNPVFLLPQVVAATILGLIFGLVKEFSGKLDIPIGMHIGNNTLAWAHCIKASL